jgi:hypothetical protein
MVAVWAGFLVSASARTHAIADSVTHVLGPHGGVRRQGTTQAGEAATASRERGGNKRASGRTHVLYLLAVAGSRDFYFLLYLIRFICSIFRRGNKTCRARV